MKVPAPYAWLANIGVLPRMVAEALQLLGTLEKLGPADNPTIVAWAKEAGLDKVYRHDETPWCGLFMAVVAKRAGKAVPDGPLWALNWGKFGVAAAKPQLGDVLTFVRDGGGHVGLYIAEDATAYHVLGGNQSDRVCFTRILKTRCRHIRRPAYTVPPATARPFLVAAAGGLSRNEA